MNFNLIISISLCISYFIIGIECRFTIVTIPDSQYYSAYFPDTINEQVYFCCNCQRNLNISLVTHEGDLVEHGNSYAVEWQTISTALKGLLGSSSNSQCSIPVNFGPGNHDSNPEQGLQMYQSYDQYFNPSTADWQFEGSFPPGTLRNNYRFFTSPNGEQFMSMNIEYVDMLFSDSYINSVLQWADSVLSNYSNVKTFLTTHFSLDDCSNYYNYDVYYLMYRHCNIIASFGGHVFFCGGENYITITNMCQQTRYIFIADYQARHLGGTGYLRYYSFPDLGESGSIGVYTYSPYLNQYELDANSYFSINVSYNWELSPVVGPGLALSDCTSSFGPPGLIIGLLWMDSLSIIFIFIIAIQFVFITQSKKHKDN